LRHLLASSGDLCRRLGERILVFLVLGNAEKKPRFFQVRVMLGPSVDDGFERRLFL
jgi:hypothetical protein